MAITRSEVERIAELARLEVPESRMERMTAELGRVLGFVETLRGLDLSDCEPVALAPATAPLREDVPGTRRLATADALAMAPAHEDGFFLVPPIVEHVEP